MRVRVYCMGRGFRVEGLGVEGLGLGIRVAGLGNPSIPHYPHKVPPSWRH